MSTQNEHSEEMIIGKCLDEIDYFIETVGLTPMARHIGIVNTLKKYIRETGMYVFWQMLEEIAGFFPRFISEYTEKFDRLFKL